MIRIEINGANIRNSHFYLAEHLGAFPTDVIGGANSAAGAARQLTLRWPFGSPVVTDIAGDKKIFRQRAWIRRLFEESAAEPGDVVLLKPAAPYEYEVDIEKKVRMATGAQKRSVGQTIQVQIKNEAWVRRAKFEIPSELKEFFPADALGARDSSDLDNYPARGASVRFDYEEAGTSICDIATKSNGIMRPRESGPVRKLFDAHGVQAGDVLFVIRLDERHYRVEVAR
jgi:hypothetical protein